MAEKRGRKKKEVDVAGKLKWKVSSGTVGLLDGRSFKRGDTFEADEHEISDSFRDIIVCVTPVEEQPAARTGPKFFLREVVADALTQDKEGYVQLYEIINAKDKVISQKPLPKEEITELLEDMNT